MSPALRPSACPGLLRIVPALDGGICRIKLNGGAISSVQAAVVADAAERFASGTIEATNRGNLQIRGIGDEQAALIESLLGAGLGPQTPAGDDVRNLMLSASAGIDAHMLVDTRPLANQILGTVQNHGRYHALSAKFAVQLDGGEALAMLEHPHDLWLSAVEQGGACWWAFGLAGCPTDAPAGAVRLEDGHALVVAVLDVFLERARPDQTRMRHLLAELPTVDVLARLAEKVALMPPPGCRRSAIPDTLHIGVHAQADTRQVYIGAVPPLGRLTSTMLRGVAQLAGEFGDASLRFTPWQSLLIPNVRCEHAGQITRRLTQLDLFCDLDPLARLIACTGSAGCSKALADTKGDALKLSGLLRRHGHVLNVHLSGCSRSCAAAHIAPITMLAVGRDHYDLYFREAGQPGFGVLHASNLTIEAAAALLDARSRSLFDA